MGVQGVGVPVLAGSLDSLLDLLGAEEAVVVGVGMMEGILHVVLVVIVVVVMAIVVTIVAIVAVVDALEDSSAVDVVIVGEEELVHAQVLGVVPVVEGDHVLDAEGEILTSNGFIELIGSDISIHVLVTIEPGIHEAFVRVVDPWLWVEEAVSVSQLLVGPAGHPVVETLAGHGVVVVGDQGLDVDVSSKERVELVSVEEVITIGVGLLEPVDEVLEDWAEDAVAVNVVVVCPLSLVLTEMVRSLVPVVVIKDSLSIGVCWEKTNHLPGADLTIAVGVGQLKVSHELLDDWVKEVPAGLRLIPE